MNSTPGSCSALSDNIVQNPFRKTGYHYGIWCISPLDYDLLSRSPVSGYRCSIPLNNSCYRQALPVWNRHIESRPVFWDVYCRKCGVQRAHAATQACHQVVYREAHTFFENVFEAAQTGKRKKITKLFSESDLLIIDDLFLRKRVPEHAADDLLDIILNRYSKRKSTLITSNRPVEDWGKLLRDNAASSAILDRLLHRGHLLKFEGKSYRLKEAAERLAIGKKKE